VEGGAPQELLDVWGWGVCRSEEVVTEHEAWLVLQYSPFMTVVPTDAILFSWDTGICVITLSFLEMI
jgi:hypothetical protein